MQGWGKWALLGMLLVVVASVAAWVVSVPGDAMYAYDVRYVMERAPELEGKTFRVKGFIVPGSVKARTTCGVTFALAQPGSGELLVDHSSCEVPDTLCDLSGFSGALDGAAAFELNAEGSLVRHQGKLLFQSFKLIAKCPGKYDTAAASKLCDYYRPGDYCRLCQRRP